MRNSIKFMPINPEPNKFYPKEISNNAMLDCEVLLQKIILNQTVNGIEKYNNITELKKYGDEIFTLGKRNTDYTYRHLIHHIRILKNDDNYKIMFCDDYFYLQHLKRRGHNENYMDKTAPFSYTDILNETAFILNPAEYGRIIYNERYVGHDTGKWYYGLHTYNIISCDKSDFKEKMFFRKNPDYEYKQLEKLL
jgi:hypothetical protein